MATEKDVFTILIDHNTETDKDISDLVNEKYCVQPFPVDIKNLRRRLRHRHKASKHKKSWKAMVESASTKIEFESCSDIFRKPVLPDKTVVELHSQPVRDLIALQNGEPPAKVRVEMYTVYMKHFHKYIHTSLSQMAKFGHKRMITTSKYCRLLKSTAGVLGYKTLFHCVSSYLIKQKNKEYQNTII